MKCIKCSWPKENEEYDFCQKCYDNIRSQKITDYQTMVNIDTPKDIRHRFDIWDIRSNSIQCNKCQDIIRSKNRHDYVTCSCGGCSVDWWSWYCKCVGNDYTDCSQVFLDAE
jgi:hypothetical protein